MAKRNTRETDSEAVDTLRLSERAQHEILSRMQRQAGRVTRVDNRTSPRVEYVPGDGITITIHHPGGSTIRYLVRPRNLSRGGINFLHGQFLYTGTPCTVALRTTEDEPMLVEGQVTRCNHVQGTVHEVGVRFASAISLADYVSDCPSEVEMTGEQTPLPKLLGKVLHVQSQAPDRELLRYYLNLVGAEAVSASSDTEVDELMDKALFDLIIVTDGHEEVITAARQREYPGPIVFMTDHDDDESHQRALAQGATQAIPKPFDAATFADMLKEHLRPDPAETNLEALVSANWPSVKMRPIILNFLASLQDQIGQLDRLANEGNIESLRDLSRTIKGSAGSYGYPQISDKARELCEMAQENAPPVQWQALVEDLKQLCERACVVRRKADSGPG